MPYGDYKKLVDYIKKENAYLKEGTEKFNALKNKAESGDVLAEFSYGEQLYYNENYLEAIYWLSKAFFDNRDTGRYYLSDLIVDALDKLQDKIIDVNKTGYGYELHLPVNVVYVTGETDYLNSITPLNGYVIKYNRQCSMANRFGTMIDKYQLIVIATVPELQLKRYTIYMNMYSTLQSDVLVEDFAYKRDIRDETKKIKVDGILISNKNENLDEKYEFAKDISKTSFGQIEAILQEKEENKKQNFKENKMKIHKTFGLDLGTTNSTVSVFMNGTNFCGEDAKQKTIPSIVAKKGNEFIVGASAKNNVNLERIRSIKRLMGKDETVELGGEKFKPEEISAQIIRYCANLLNKQIEKAPNVIYDRIVITVPAYFSIAQKDATRKAGELAGLDVLMLLEEPTAAAINYTVKNNIENGIFMVYDLGGGTFDVSIIEKIENIPVVLATAGNNFLGGDNFDNMLARYFIDVLNNDLGYEIDTALKSSNPHKYNALLLAAENVKKNLSQNEIFSINYYDVFKDNSGVDLIIDEFSRKQFENIIKDKIVIDTFNECQKALDIFEKSGRNVSEIDGILMVGGSSHIPFVKQALKEKYIDTGLIKKIIIEDPDLAVGYGAGIIAATQPTKIEDEENNIVVEVNAPYLFDGITNISGKVLSGDITKIGIISNNNEWFSSVMEDKSFSVDISENISNIDYKFYSGDKEISTISEDISKNNLIAPTPVQNETIRIEIVDLDKQEIDNFPLVNKGEALPCSAIHNFKVNEYSREQIILPVKEGYREIYRIVATLPDNTAIGSRVTIKTEIDVLGKVNLTILLNDKPIKGDIVYSEVKSTDASIDDINTSFNNKILNVKGSEKEKFVQRQENILRELSEAKENNDNGHYTDVIDKYETLVNELPNEIPDLTEADFDEIEKELKEIAKSNPNLNISKIEDDVYFGKRSLARNDYTQAQEKYRSLCSTKEIFSISPKVIFAIMLKHIVDLLQEAGNLRYSIQDTSLIQSIEQEIRNVNLFLNSLDLNNLENFDDEKCKDLTQKLLSKSNRLVALLEQTGVKEINEKIKNFQGRISKD